MRAVLIAATEAALVYLTFIYRVLIVFGAKIINMSKEKPIFNPKFSHEQVIESALDYMVGECQMDGVVILATWRDKDGETYKKSLQSGNSLAIENMVNEIAYTYEQKWELDKAKIRDKYKFVDYEQDTETE